MIKHKFNEETIKTRVQKLLNSNKRQMFVIANILLYFFGGIMLILKILG